MNACPKCQHAHVVGDARATNRFDGATSLYRTTDGVIHASRDGAQTWLCEQRRTKENADA